MRCNYSIVYLKLISEGTTIHTGLGFKFGSDMLDFSPEKQDLTRRYLENVEVVIVDEMSLVSSDNLFNLHKRLQEIFALEDTFGGRCVLLAGDILQLPPIRTQQIFSEPKQFDSTVVLVSESPKPRL